MTMSKERSSGKPRLPRVMANGLLSLLLLSQCYGCVALLAGAAGGAGTAVWLSNKLTQDVNAPAARVVNAAKASLKKMKLNVDKETTTEDVTQIISEYTDGKKVWVDVHQVTEKSSRLEIRVGVVGDEEPARKILDEILKRL